MNTRPRPAYAVALATAMVGAAPLPLVAQEADEPVAQHCYTEALTVAEVLAGEHSVIECYPIGEEPASRAVDLADIYLGAGGSGTSITLRGAACTNAAVSFDPSSTWDNSISSTQLLACGAAKHYTGANFTGSNQLVVGGAMTNMNATLNNQTTSIEYAP